MTPDERAAFGRRLKSLLDQKGMNYSDLARAVWGTTTTKEGYAAAKNRDRISCYVNGTAFPRAPILKKIADVLGVQITDLAPNYGMVDDENPEWSLIKCAGQDKVLLRINKLMDSRRAAQIAALLTDPKQ